MDLETLRAYALTKPAATEDMPFGPNALVFKVMGKMFALVGWRSTPLWINLKCDPVLAQILRDQYAAVEPGYHMNKRHWNTVRLDGSIPEDEITEMVDHSYDQVVANLSRRQREAIAGSPDDQAPEEPR